MQAFKQTGFHTSRYGDMSRMTHIESLSLSTESVDGTAVLKRNAHYIS